MLPSMPPNPELTRPKTRSFILPQLGFGGAGIGNAGLAITDTAAAATLGVALTNGIRYFDTAPYYGFGLSERRLGALLQDHNVLVSTKVGRRLDPIVSGPYDDHGFVDAEPYLPTYDYSYDGVMKSFETSLSRLRRERVDLLLAHDLGRATHGDDHSTHLKDFLDGGLAAMVELKVAGLIDAIGLGVNEWQICEEMLKYAEFDVFLLAGRYTLLEQTPLETLFPSCAKRGVSIVVGGPYNSGILVRGVKGSSNPRYNYSAAPAHIVRRVAKLEDICDNYNVPLAAAALQFPLAHPQVASIIPGMASAREVTETIGWMALSIPDSLWSDMKTEGLLPDEAPTPRSHPATVRL